MLLPRRLASRPSGFHILLSLDLQTRASDKKTKIGNSRKWLGEGAKGLLDQGSEKPLVLVQPWGCTGAKQGFGLCKRLLGDLLTLGPKDLLHPLLTQMNVRNPDHHYFSKKYRNTPPICIAIRLQFVSQYFWCHCALRKGNTSVLLPFVSQYTSHLYRSTPPICIAMLLGKSWWLWSPGCSPLTTFGNFLFWAPLPGALVCKSKDNVAINLWIVA